MNIFPDTGSMSEKYAYGFITLDLLFIMLICYPQHLAIHVINSPIPFIVALLILSQSDDNPGVSEGILKNMDGMG